MTNQVTTLSDIASIKLGLTFKKAIDDLTNKGGGEFFLVQTKNITIDGSIDMTGLPQVVPEVSPNGHFLKSGDLLLRLRGPIFSAAVFEDSFSLPVITTNLTAVIRCNLEKVSPYYLQWFINSPSGQHCFQKAGEGTNITKVSAKTVSNLQLPLPDREQQDKIELIYKNWLAQKNAYKRLIDNGDTLYNQLCKKIQIGTL